MRARLKTMKKGQQFNCICDEKVAEKIERVVTFADGIVKSKEKKNGDTVFCVVKGG